MTASSKRWAGKVALVTGASSGIGAAIAERLVADGLKVAVCARRRDRLMALAKSLAGGPGEIEGHQVDLRSEQDILKMFTEIRSRWGGVDLLINNAGLGHKASLSAGETEAWREVLEVNVLALAICTREALRDMRARGDTGHVVHISSMSAHRVPKGSGMYSASKHAVAALTEALRQELRELGSSIRVTSISPGFVETEFAEQFHKSKAAAKETYSQFEVLKPADIADLVAYAIDAPPHVQLHDMLVRPTDQRS